METEKAINFKIDDYNFDGKKTLRSIISMMDKALIIYIEFLSTLRNAVNSSKDNHRAGTRLLI
ncbi:hypothetical protein IP84_15530 [beta proteobacterium AAP99]|nr:hypothetical protein IP84_15530 [beta proteobacterium AAP99]